MTDRRAKESYDRLMAHLSSPDDKELLMNVWHDVWHMGHSKGWTDAKSVYAYQLQNAVEAFLAIDTFSVAKWKKICKALFAEHGHINDYRVFVKETLR